MNVYKLLLVGVGGFAGSVARYLTALLVDGTSGPGFPYGTLTVNLVGSFLLGCIFGWLLRLGDSAENMKLLLITGFCGGFTTFSAFAFENLNLINQRAIGTALIYIVSSLVLGVLAVAAGIWTAKSMG